MYKLIIENQRGQKLELTNNPKFTIDKITGLTPPPAEISLSENIGDGAEFKHERTSKRNIVIDMYINGNVEDNRIELYNYIKNGKYIKLYFENGRRNVWIEGYVETLEIDNFTMNTTCQISVLCPNPWWKDISEIIHVMSNTISALYFPFYTIHPIPFSVYSSILVRNLINKGDISSGITIEMYAKGTIINPKFYNRETGEFIGLGTTENPYTLLPGDKIVITTHSNSKKVVLIREAEEINVFNYLTPNSVFLQITPGDNIFTYVAETGNEYMDVSFRYYSQYEGV